MIRFIQELRRCFGLIKEVDLPDIGEIEDIPQPIVEVVPVKIEKQEDTTFILNKPLDQPSSPTKEKAKMKKERKKKPKETQVKESKIDLKENPIPASATVPIIILEKKPLKSILKKPRKFF